MAELLNVAIPTLERLAQFRGVVLPAKARRVDIVQVLAARAPVNAGPFGINRDDPLYRQALELRQLSVAALQRWIAVERHTETDSTSYPELIMMILGVPDPLPPGFDDAYTQMIEALRLYDRPITKLQQMEGSTATNKAILVNKLLSGTSGTLTGEAYNIAAIYQTYGVTRQRVIGRALTPPTYDLRYANDYQLVEAVRAGTDMSSLMPPLARVPLGGLQILEQAIALLGVPFDIAGTVGERYAGIAELLQLYSKYPPAAWWPTAQAYTAKLPPTQRLIGAERLGLLPPGAAGRFTANDVVFALSHGGLAPERLPPLSPDALAVIAKRPTSSMIPIYEELARLPAADLPAAAAVYGIYLPQDQPQATLDANIFLYEWVNPNRAPLQFTSLQQRTQAELTALLRQYNDFELLAILPGFAKAATGRRALLNQVIAEVQRPFYVAATAGDGLVVVSPDGTTTLYGWNDLAAVDYTTYPIDYIQQILNVLGKVPGGTGTAPAQALQWQIEHQGFTAAAANVPPLTNPPPYAVETLLTLVGVTDYSDIPNPPPTATFGGEVMAYTLPAGTPTGDTLDTAIATGYDPNVAFLHLLAWFPAALPLVNPFLL